MNKVFRKIHLWLSVPVGLIITVICLTGAALVFERDITESLNPKIYKVAYTEGDTPAAVRTGRLYPPAGSGFVGIALPATVG